MSDKPTYEELEQRVRELEQAESEHKKTENKLKESEKRYRSFCEQSNDAIIIHDLNGQIIAANSKACEMLGYERKKFSSMTIPMTAIISPTMLIRIGKTLLEILVILSMMLSGTIIGVRIDVLIMDATAWRRNAAPKSLGVFLSKFIFISCLFNYITVVEP